MTVAGGMNVGGRIRHAALVWRCYHSDIFISLCTTEQGHYARVRVGVHARWRVECAAYGHGQTRALVVMCPMDTHRSCIGRELGTRAYLERF
jgi:hypothetical protein